MQDSKISSKYLFHFTKSADVLVSILKNGFYPMTAIEDISFMLPNYKEARVGIPMVCFTDIPFSESEMHREEYGQFGIALSKEWGMRKGLNPISYIVKNSEMYNAYNHLQYMAQKNAIKLDNGNCEGIFTLNMMDAVMNYAGFMKEYSHELNFDMKPYYDEREWRYLPPFKEETSGINGYCNRLDPSIVDDIEKRQELNEKMKHYYKLQFEVEDISQIVLPNDYDVQKFIRILYEEHFANDLEAYISKIVQ